ncbi:MAG: hypothetical protein ACHQRM_00810 [Bacteroidia bacterium]
MKKQHLILFLLAISVFPALIQSQHYIRTKKNIGILVNAYVPDYSVYKGTTSGKFQGTGYAVGITHDIRGFLYPELFFASHMTQVVVPGDHAAWSPAGVTTNAVGAGLTFKKDLLEFNMKKKKGYCFGRMLNILLGPEYVYPLGGSMPSGVKAEGEFAAKAGLGMYSVWGGSSKSHAGWVIHWEFYYRRSLTPLLQSDFGVAGNNQYTLSSFGITLRVIHFRTYKFSEM